MRGGSEADYENRGPKAFDLIRENDGSGAEGANEHGEFTGGIDARAVTNQARRKPAAGDAADVRDQIDDRDGSTDFREHQIMPALQKVGHPEEIEPPDGIGEKFAYDERICLAVREQSGPLDFPDGFGRIRADVIELGSGYSRMLVRFAVQQKPEYEPAKSERASKKKGGAPAPERSHPWRQERRDDGADAGAGVENAGGQGALLFGEPFGDGFDAGGEDAGFAETQRETRGRETDEGARSSMGHRGETPERHGQRVTCARTEAIDEASDEEHAGRIGHLEIGNEMAVLDVVPAEVVLQSRLQDAEQ